MNSGRSAAGLLPHAMRYSTGNGFLLNGSHFVQQAHTSSKRTELRLCGRHTMDKCSYNAARLLIESDFLWRQALRLKKQAERIGHVPPMLMCARKVDDQGGTSLNKLRRQ